MSRTRKISITLPEDLIETIRAAVQRGEARSVSSYIASRLAPDVIMDALFAEWDTERGEPSRRGRCLGQERTRACLRRRSGGHGAP